MSDFCILKTLEDLFVIVFMLENLKKKVDKSLLFYLYQLEASALASFNIIFENFERRLHNGS